MVAEAANPSASIRVTLLLLLVSDFRDCFNRKFINQGYAAFLPYNSWAAEDNHENSEIGQNNSIID